MTFPRLVSHSACAVAASTGPPSTRSRRSAISVRESGCNSTRSQRSSFQSATIASGVSSRDRTATTTDSNPSARSSSAASWCTSAADAGSSVCPSSTTSTRRAPAARRVSSFRTAPSGFSEPPPSELARRCANAPSGTEAAARLAAMRSTCAPSRRASVSASRMSRVFPTPAAPATTAPPLSRSARSSAASSASRPTSGHEAPARRGGLRSTGAILLRSAAGLQFEPWEAVP